MTAPSKDFSGLDFDFALGEVYGLRAWWMDEFGRLRARNWTKAGPWRPGRNTAVCLADNRASLANLADPSGRGRTATNVEMQIGAGMQPAYRITWDDGTTETATDLAYIEAPPHPVPDEDCTCGFYAYTQPDHAETSTTGGGAGFAMGGVVFHTGITFGPPAGDAKQMVLGVIKGTGRTLIGTKGFRCEHAEIVALRDPTRGGRKTADWREAQLANLRRIYPDVPLLPSRSALLEFAPVEQLLPDPSTDEFWSLP